MIEQCKSCKNKEIINGIIGCVYMDADCQNGEKYEAEIIANADRIRAMSDEELAEFLNRVKEPCDYCQLAVVEGACTETLCDDAMMKWLQQPAEENDNG